MCHCADGRSSVEYLSCIFVANIYAVYFGWEFLLNIYINTIYIITHGNFLAIILCQWAMAPVPMCQWPTEWRVLYAFTKWFLCQCRHVSEYVMPTWRCTSGKNGKAAKLAPSYIIYVPMPACQRVCYAEVETHQWENGKAPELIFIHDLCVNAGMSATMKCWSGDAPVVRIYMNICCLRYILYASGGMSVTISCCHGDAPV